jgi:hypothetical protein
MPLVARLGAPVHCRRSGSLADPISGCSAAWQRATFGTWRPRVQIPASRPPRSPSDLGLRLHLAPAGAGCSPIAHVGAEDEAGDDLGGGPVQRRQRAGVGIQRLGPALPLTNRLPGVQRRRRNQRPQAARSSHPRTGTPRQASQQGGATGWPEGSALPRLPVRGLPNEAGGCPGLASPRTRADADAARQERVQVHLWACHPQRPRPARGGQPRSSPSLWHATTRL